VNRMKLSKSRFVAGVQCLKRLYWQVHAPELAAEPDASAYAIMEQGREVGILARQLFPGGVEVLSDGGLDQAIYGQKQEAFGLSDYRYCLAEVRSASVNLGWPPQEVDFFAWKMTP
jgi:hypothetical protein